jgi:hypothetical protein
MTKTLHTIFPIVALCLLGGILFMLITAIYSPAGALIWMNRTIASPAQPSCSTRWPAEGPCVGAVPSGCTVFTRKPQGDGYLVSTNFNVANPANGYGYPCSCYETAQELLGTLVSRGGELTAQDATDALDAVHVEGGASWTIESLVADLPGGIVYLYCFHQFDQPVVLNLAEEIANPRAGGPLSRLFPEDVQQEGVAGYLYIQQLMLGS